MPPQNCTGPVYGIRIVNGVCTSTGTLNLCTLERTGRKGIEGSPFVNQVNLYPNPATGAVTIDVPNEGFEVAFYTLIGEKIWAQKVASRQATIDVSRLLPGSYVVKIQNEDTQTVHRLQVTR